MTSKTMNDPKGKGLAAGRVDVKKLATMAMLVALAYVVTVVTRFPLMAAASYLKYDPKDVVLLIGAYLFGPLAGAAMSVATCFIEMITVSEAGIYGFIMNVVASCAFILPSAFLYHRRRTMGGAIAGLALGVVAMAATMVLWNYIITPIYEGLPRGQVAGMLATVFLPFNAIKAVLNAALTLMLYQPVTNALRRTHLLPALPDGSLRRSYNLGAVVLGLFLLATGVLLVLVLRGAI